MKDETENETELTQPESGLNLRQERFCLEYLKDFNATAAAKRAGYGANSAHCSGSRILALPAVKQFLRVELNRINTDIRVAAEAVNKELLAITFLERGEFLDKNGDLKNMNELPEQLRAAVQISTKKIKSGAKETTVTTYNLFDKIKMMEKISKRRPADNQPNGLTERTPVTEDLGDGIVVNV